MKIFKIITTLVFILFITNASYLAINLQTSTSIEAKSLIVKNDNISEHELVKIIFDGKELIIFNNVFIILFFTLTILFSYLIFRLFAFIKSLNKKRLEKEQFLRLQGTEAKLANKNISLLAENIHHELKTPLLVINDFIKEFEKKYDMPQGDMELLNSHINMIYNIIERMKNYKFSKVSADNKTIFEIMDMVFKTMNLFSKVRYKYTVDPLFRQYGIRGDLTNEDISNILLNQVKNSIEANSTEIEFRFLGYEDKVLHIQMIDNGGGIPENFIPYVFKENSSSKAGIARGNGLYLSKTTLQFGKGDILLIETSGNGTSFRIDLPCKRI